MGQKSSFSSLKDFFPSINTESVLDISNLKKLVMEAKTALEKLETALGEPPCKITTNQSVYQSTDKPTIDGVFDGQNMVGEDGTIHPVPENYVSKSRLLEGDLLQLVGDRYRQVSRVPRKLIEGKLKENREEYGVAVTSDGNLYQIAPAAIRFFRASVGNTLILEIPEENGAIWAAVVSREEPCYTTTVK